MHGDCDARMQFVQDNLWALLQAPGIIRVPRSLHSVAARLSDCKSTDDDARRPQTQEVDTRTR